MLVIPFSRNAMEEHKHNRKHEENENFLSLRLNFARFHCEINAFVLAFVPTSVLTSVVKEIMHWSGFQMTIGKAIPK